MNSPYYVMDGGMKPCDKLHEAIKAQVARHGSCLLIGGWVQSGSSDGYDMMECRTEGGKRIGYILRAR